MLIYFQTFKLTDLFYCPLTHFHLTLYINWLPTHHSSPFPYLSLSLSLTLLPAHLFTTLLIVSSYFCSTLTYFITLTNTSFKSIQLVSFKKANFVISCTLTCLQHKYLYLKQKVILKSDCVNNYLFLCFRNSFYSIY